MQLRFVRPRFHAKALREIVSWRAAQLFEHIAGRVTSIIMNVVLLALGGQNAVSVYGILMTMDGFVHPLLYGMCDSLQPAVGFNWGARNIQRVKAIEKRCYTAAIILALATTGVLALFPRQIAGLFITGDSDPAYLEMAVHALVLFSLTYITRWFSFATQSFLSAIEKPVAALRHFRVHGPGVPGNPHRRVLASRPDRPVAELCWHCRAGGHLGFDSPAAAERAVEQGQEKSRVIRVLSLERRPSLCLGVFFARFSKNYVTNFPAALSNEYEKGARKGVAPRVYLWREIPATALFRE